MIHGFQLDFHLEKTLSLEQALREADFVILTITTPPVIPVVTIFYFT